MSFCLGVVDFGVCPIITFHYNYRLHSAFLFSKNLFFPLIIWYQIALICSGDLLEKDYV